VIALHKPQHCSNADAMRKRLWNLHSSRNLLQTRSW